MAYWLGAAGKSEMSIACVCGKGAERRKKDGIFEFEQEESQRMNEKDDCVKLLCDNQSRVTTDSALLLMSVLLRRRARVMSCPPHMSISILELNILAGTYCWDASVSLTSMRAPCA